MKNDREELEYENIFVQSLEFFLEDEGFNCEDRTFDEMFELVYSSNEKTAEFSMYLIGIITGFVYHNNTVPKSKRNLHKTK